MHTTSRFTNFSPAKLTVASILLSCPSPWQEHLSALDIALPGAVYDRSACRCKAAWMYGTCRELQALLSNMSLMQESMLPAQQIQNDIDELKAKRDIFRANGKHHQVETCETQVEPHLPYWHFRSVMRQWILHSHFCLERPWATVHGELSNVPTYVVLLYACLQKLFLLRGLLTILFHSMVSWTSPEALHFCNI